MVIIHFACITDNKFNDVLFVNVNNFHIDELNNQCEYNTEFDLYSLPEPFNKPDLVIFHETYRVEYLQIYKKLIRLNIPYIIVPHGELSIEAQKKKFIKKKIANILLFNSFIMHSLAIQCLSIRECERTHFKHKKIIATNGISIPKKTKEFFSENGINFVYIGRLDSYHKGLDLLIDAVKINKEKFIDQSCRLYIYGPDYRGRFEKVKRMINDNGLNELVILNEAVTGIEKENILLNTDVFIQTSRFEGMPMGILEALSYGIPCIVTEGTTLADKIDGLCGWGCKTNSQSISMAVADSIINKDLLIKYSIKSREFIVQNFAWEVVAKNTIDLYKNLLSERNFRA